MFIHIDSRGPVSALVSLEGRMDLLAAPAVAGRLKSLIAAGTPNLIVDMGRVPFMDSTGLAALVATLKAARVAGGDLTLARVNQQVQGVLELTNLDRVFVPDETLAGMPESAEPRTVSAVHG